MGVLKPPFKNLNMETRIIRFKGVTLFVKFKFYEGHEATNTPPNVELHEAWHNDSEITELLDGSFIIDEIEDKIFNTFKEELYGY